MALKHYVGTLLILCLFGFFKELKPSEPYLTEYLTGSEYKNLTKDDVYQKVYPVWSYSYFFVLIPVFLLTDLLRYKPMIMFEGLVYVITWVLLLWAEGVVAMQIMQFIYGMATASEIAYYTYIYAKVKWAIFNSRSFVSSRLLRCEMNTSERSNFDCTEKALMKKYQRCNEFS